MATVDVTGFGHVEAEEVTGTKTLDTGDSGVVQNVTATTTVTLPATNIFARFIIRIGKPGLTVNISPNAADYIIGNGRVIGSAVDNKDLIFTNQPAGSYVELHGDGTNGYTVARILGTATFEA